MPRAAEDPKVPPVAAAFIVRGGIRETGPVESETWEPAVASPAGRVDRLGVDLDE